MSRMANLKPASGGGSSSPGAIAGAVVVDFTSVGDNILHTVPTSKKFTPKGAQGLCESIAAAGVGATIEFYMDAVSISTQFVLGPSTVGESDFEIKLSDEGSYAAGAQFILKVVNAATHGTHTGRVLAKGDEYDA